MTRNELVKEAYDRGCAAAARDLRKLAEEASPMSPGGVAAMSYLPFAGGWAAPIAASHYAPRGMEGRTFSRTLGGELLGSLGGAIPGGLVGAGLGALGGHPLEGGVGGALLGALVGQGVGTYHGYKGSFSPEQQQKYFGG